MKRRIVIAVILAIACSGAALANETVVSGPLVPVSLEEFSDVGGGVDLWHTTAYNPSGIQIGDELHLFVQGWVTTNSSPAWATCGEARSDNVIQFSSDDVEDDFEAVGRVSPCCGNEAAAGIHYGVGSVAIAPWSGEYVIFVDRTSGGSSFGKGHFVEVIMGTSEDGETWDFPGYDYVGRCDYPGNMNPVVKRSNGISIIDITVTSDGDNKLWGLFKFGTEHATHVGRIEIIGGDPENGRGFYVRLKTLTGWHVVDEDGSFDLEEADLEDVWPGVSPNSIYHTGSGYEVWAHALTSVSGGCDTWAPETGHTFVYRSIADWALGPVQSVFSTVEDFPLPSGTQYSRLFPYRVDFNGDSLLFFSTDDRVCETLGSTEDPLWDEFGSFRGMEILAVSLDNTIDSNDCDPFADQLCLYDDRFSITGENENGDMIVMPFSDQSAGFRDAEDPERVISNVKIVDATGLKGYWWTIHGSASENPYGLTFHDFETNTTQEYDNDELCGGADLTAFEDAESKSPFIRYGSSKSMSSEKGLKAHSCSDPDYICLLGGRFEIHVTHSVPGPEGKILWSDSSGAFYFGDDQLLEIFVTIETEGENYSFYYGSTTNLNYAITVHDTYTGNTAFFTNPTAFCGGTFES